MPVTRPASAKEAVLGFVFGVITGVIVGVLLGQFRFFSEVLSPYIKMPPAFVSNGLTTKAAYVAELAQDKGQFLPNGMMHASGSSTVLAIEKFTGNVTGPVNLAGTYTNKHAVAANKLEGFPS